MIRIGIVAFALSLALNGCKGQAIDDEQITDNHVLPKGNISVKKEYDNNGNLIKYDSSYSYYYSNIKHDRNLEDSLLDSFKNYFNQRYFFSNEPYFSSFFFQDSLMNYDFYKKDFFLNRYMNNMERMDSIFREMDSVKNNFFYNQFTLPKHSYKQGIFK